MEYAPDLAADDLYARLGVERAATPDAIKHAYLALVRQYTPERAPEEFKRIREAYETLSNPASRSQYDRRPDPHIAQLLERASKATAAKDYPVAEQAYKQVLLESPELHWVRNLLGLCFLYQQQPDKAIAQYERLIGGLFADASVHGNAAHAYRMTGRYADAEREFRTAMRLAGDQALEYGLGLVQMHIDRHDYTHADEIAQAEFNGAVVGSLAQAEYGCKRIELALLTGKKNTIGALVNVISRGATTDEQRRYVAFAMGKLAIRLVDGEVFDTAQTVGSAAQSLQPTDPDYDALSNVAQLLGTNNLDAVRRVLTTHVSFAKNGWLYQLRGRIEHYCTTHAVFNGMRPIKGPPTLRCVNGIGTRLMGNRDADSPTNSYVATRYATVFFVPVFPIECFRVRPAQNGGWYFLGRVPYGRAQKIHWVIFLLAIGTWIISGLASQSSGGGAVTSGGPTVGEVAAVPTVGSLANPPTATPSEPSEHDSGELSGPALSVYEGEATNTTTASNPIKAPLRLTIHSWRQGPGAYLRVFPPLAGSGSAFVSVRSDSMRMASVSPMGDSIFWLGARRGDTVDGAYEIMGGPYKGQWGSWRVSRTSGAPLPRRLRPWH
jgi:tetratricopeptide (TPR) repeat protein